MRKHPPDDERQLQLDLIEAAEEITTAAIEQAGEHADEDWKEAAKAAARTVALTHERFTTDQIWALLDGVAFTHEPRAMGGILRWAVAEGLIRQTAYFRKTARIAAHRRPMRIWESRVYRATGADKV